MLLTKEQVFHVDDFKKALEAAVEHTKNSTQLFYLQYVDGATLNWNIENKNYHMENPEEFNELDHYFVLGNEADKESGEAYFKFQAISVGPKAYVQMFAYPDDIARFAVDAAIYLYNKFYITLSLEPLPST